MTTTEAPRFSRKEIRQAANELDQAGYRYAGDDAKGHALYLYWKPCQKHTTAHCDNPLCSVSLPETPKSFSLTRMRSKIARTTGQKSRNGYSAATARERRTKAQQAEARFQASIAAQRAALAAVRKPRNLPEHRQTEYLMGARGSLHARFIPYEDLSFHEKHRVNGVDDTDACTVCVHRRG